MDALPKTQIDFSKIVGPYQLLAVFLLVVEGLLGFWLFRAGNASERVTAGCLMTFMLLAFLVSVIALTKKSEKEIVPQGLDRKVTPAASDATHGEIISPPPDTIVAPDRSYIIAEPPGDWIVSELTWADWISLNLRITDNQVRERVLAEVPGLAYRSDRADILELRSKREVSIIPIPGKSIIDGRKTPTALEVAASTRLSIVPIERLQPPYFVERSLMQNFLNEISNLSRVLSMQGLTSGVLPDGKRRYLKAEFRQEIEDAIVDGKEEKAVQLNNTVIGIEGELKDFLLIMNYVSLTRPSRPKWEQDLQTLLSLVSSFRPQKIVNPEEKRQEIADHADKMFKTLMKDKGKEIFTTEIGLLLLRIKDWNLNEPEKRLKTLAQMKAFEVFAKEIKLEDEDFDGLWDALHKAESGDLSDLENRFKLLTEALSSSESDEEASPSLPEGRDAQQKNT